MLGLTLVRQALMTAQHGLCNALHHNLAQSFQGLAGRPQPQAADSAWRILPVRVPTGAMM